MIRQTNKRMEDEKALFATKEQEKANMNKPIEKQVIAKQEPVVIEETPEVEKTKDVSPDKNAKDKIKNIFDL